MLTGRGSARNWAREQESSSIYWTALAARFTLLHTIFPPHKLSSIQFLHHMIFTTHNFYSTQFLHHTIFTPHNFYSTQFLLHTSFTQHKFLSNFYFTKCLLTQSLLHTMFLHTIFTPHKFTPQISSTTCQFHRHCPYKKVGWPLQYFGAQGTHDTVHCLVLP